MQNLIGIMQGRLSPRPAGKLQAFPSASWRDEFAIAARLGFDAIEWIFELDGYGENPIWHASGRAEIRRISAASGVAVRSVCADYFMLRRLAGDGASAVRANVETLMQLIEAARDIGASRILLPLLETSSVPTPEAKAELCESLRRAAPVAAEHGIVLGLEMEIPGEEYAALVARVDSAHVRAYYDVGNSAAQGYDVADDVVPLLPYLHAVHVKDRLRGGSSVPLGSGDTHFAGFFRQLVKAGFAGDFLLQHFFDTQPEASARDALAFVRQGLATARKS